MSTFFLTVGVMLKRSMAERGLVWFSAVFPVAVLLLSGGQAIPGRMVSVAALLPCVFLLAGWPGSKSRKGLSALLFRSGTENGVRVAEMVFPAVMGILLSSVTALVFFFPPPWQFWITTVFATFSLVTVFLILEQKMPLPGRFVLGMLWLSGLSIDPSSEGIQRIFLPPCYPGGVLHAHSACSQLHPDTYVMASVGLTLAASAAYWFLCRD